MKTRFSLYCLVLAAALLTRPTSAAEAAGKPAERRQDIAYPPLNPIRVPSPERYTLDNGLVVYLLEDHQLPLVTASALVRAGSRWEPAKQAGLASIVGSVIRTGGTATYPGDQLDDQLDSLGASIETGLGEDSGGASLSVLKEDCELGFTILADLLRNPAFPEAKIELEKIALRDAISRRNDDPASIPGREFRRLLLGQQSAYGHQPEFKTIEAVTSEECRQFHRQFFQPENTMLGVWGDFSSADMKALIQKTFGAWPKGGQPKPEAPAIDEQAARTSGLFFIAKEDVNQTWVRMGQLGGKFNDPDFFALEVMDTILGGGFSSRLFSKVRSDLGLAYSVGSSWSPGWDRPGLFVAAGSTKSQSTIQFLEAVRKEVVNMTRTEVTEVELKRAQDSILKGFAFEFDAAGKVVARLMKYEYFGYPKEFLQTYQENIAKVTRADVARVAKTHLQPEKFAIVVLGNAKAFEKPLDSLGKVTEIDISIPKE
jgi:zinc protease